ncbi:glycosyltransferase [Candidatus Woesearchaeota archaeon]|nr:glycosyltransferase [Candidatus Woesearchaeota archaeon]
MDDVSFVIPNYNGEKTIVKAVKSILNQSYKGRVEVIIVDDFSKDNSTKIINLRFKNKKNVRLIKSEKNLGLANSLNKGIENSQYDLIGILMCDCELASRNWLRNMVKTINSDKKIGSVCSRYILPESVWKEYSFFDKAIFAREYYLSVTGKKKGGKHALLRKDILKEINGYDAKSFRIAGEDVDLMSRIMEKGYNVVLTSNKIMHYHVYYRLNLRKHLFNKALPIGEAIGVNFRKHGFKSMGNKYWNAFTATFIYIGLFIPVIRWFSLIIVIFSGLIFTGYFLKYSRDVKAIFLPFFKVVKDIFNIIGFWKGFITNRQKL